MNSYWLNYFGNDHFDFQHFVSTDVDQGGSLIWKNAQKFKHILRKGVKWKVGNGRKVIFWEEIWILDHPLCVDPRWNRFMEQCNN